MQLGIASETRWKSARRWLWPAGGLLVFALVLHFGVGPLARRVIAACRDAGPCAFFAAMAVLPAFGFPVFPFVAAAGPAFAERLGFGHVLAYVLLALAADVSLSYVLGCRPVRPVAIRIASKLGQKLPDLSGVGAWETAFLVRLVPGTPFFLQGIALAALHVPFGIYLAASLLVPAGYFAALLLLGEAVAQADVWASLGALALLIAAAFAALAARKSLARKFHENSSRSAEAPEQKRPKATEVCSSAHRREPEAVCARR